VGGVVAVAEDVMGIKALVSALKKALL